MRRLFAHADFVSVPLAIAAIVAMHPPTHLADVTAIAGGVLAWTLIEYWVHRAMHMRRFPKLRRLHVKHHQHPTAPSGGTLYSSAIILLLLITACTAPVLAPGLGGLLLGYLFFIVLHHAEHHGWPLQRSPLRPLADAHDLHHHAGPARMFGVSTTLWDRVFGTA